MYFPLPGDVSAGAYTGIYYMTKAQADLGNAVSVITSRSVSKKQPTYEQKEKIKIHRVFSSLPGPFCMPYWAYGFNAIRKFNQLNKEEDFDLIHAHDRETFLFGLKNKLSKTKPLFLHSHGLIKGWENAGVFDESSFVNQLSVRYARKFYEKIALKNADFIFAYSEYSKNEIINFYGIDSDRIHVIKNATDTNHFKSMKSSIRTKLGLDGDFVILTMGTSKRKGFPLLASAVEQLSKNNLKIKLLVIGVSETEKISVLKKYSKIKDNLVFLETIPHHSMPLYYNSCDLFALPTVYEGIPKSLIEAMSCGKPVLTTRVCGIPEIVKDGVNGLLVDPNNLMQLKQKISYALNNEKTCNQIGKQARRDALQKYTWEKFAERINGGYERYFAELNRK